MGMGMAEILWEVCGNGDRCCGNTAGTEIGAVGMPRAVEFVFCGNCYDAGQLLYSCQQSSATTYCVWGRD